MPRLNSLHGQAVSSWYHSVFLEIKSLSKPPSQNNITKDLQHTEKNPFMPFVCTTFKFLRRIDQEQSGSKESWKHSGSRMLGWVCLYPGENWVLRILGSWQEVSTFWKEVINIWIFIVQTKSNTILKIRAYPHCYQANKSNYFIWNTFVFFRLTHFFLLICQSYFCLLRSLITTFCSCFLYCTPQPALWPEANSFNSLRLSTLGYKIDTVMLYTGVVGIQRDGVYLRTWHCD